MSKPIVSQDELIAFAKPYLKERGFKKKNKRWTKVLDEFTLVFFIQGSQWSKEDYYIRPGVFINDIYPKDCWVYYGHFHTDIDSCSTEQIFNDLEVFFREWTDKKLIKSRTLAFIEWEKRNPLEDRRARKVDYEKDPVPAKELFAVPTIARNYIIEHY